MRFPARSPPGSRDIATASARTRIIIILEKSLLVESTVHSASSAQKHLTAAHSYRATAARRVTFVATTDILTTFWEIIK